MGAALVYAVAAIAGIALFDRIHTRLEHSVLLWQWEHIGMPLLRAALLLVFILMAYPVLFGISEAPSLGELVNRHDMRLGILFNLIFIVTLLVPLLPVIGDWNELVLPLQGVAASLLLFSWLADASGLESPGYWPGWGTVLLMSGLAIITHWLAMALSATLGEWLDRRFNVIHAGELLSRSLVLMLQYPVIVVFCHGLGKQIA